MASVFLSYDREDAERARSVASALERAGHSVWWDRHIKGGAQYSKEIEQALAVADAVVVLWSERSVDSAWVRDEAAAGRDAGKLVPARLDAVNPPMGFRQYQMIDLSRWKGRRSAEPFRELDRAIHGLATARTATEPATVRKAPVPVQGWFGRRGLAALLVLTAIMAGGSLIMRQLSTSTIPVVAVAAADSSPTSAAAARDLLTKLGSLQAAQTDFLQLTRQGEGAGRKADLVFEVGGSSDADNAGANLVLLAGKDRSVLWSKDFQEPGQALPDLRQQVAVTAGRVLGCALEALTVDQKLDQPTLRLYLNGCARLSELSGTEFRRLVPVFRDVTRRAPKFEGGWAKLLLSEAYVIDWEIISDDSLEGSTLRKDIAAVRKLNLDPPEAYRAEYSLAPNDALIEQAALLERAKSRHPDAPVILNTESDFLLRVGRMKEAVANEKRATQLEPLDPGGVGFYINVLAWAGQIDTARQELEKAEKLWPGTRSLLDARWRHHLRYGDPKEALKITRSGVNPDYLGLETYLLARIDPSRKNVERAVAHAKAQVGREPRATGMLIQTLAEFGREEEIFSILEELRSREVNDSLDAFFRPAFRRFRQDARFMRIAQKYGLVEYWRKSGKWPDFCFDPDLPYDCKVEAAKLSARSG